MEFKSIVGFLMIELAMSSAIIGLCGYDLTLKDKVLTIVGIMVFMTLITVGATLYCS